MEDGTLEYGGNTAKDYVPGAEVLKDADELAAAGGKCF